MLSSMSFEILASCFSDTDSASMGFTSVMASIRMASCNLARDCSRCLTLPNNTEGSKGFDIKMSIPSLTLSFSVLLSVFAVSIIIGIFARRVFCFKRCIISNPFITGINSSDIIKSGMKDCAIESPAASIFRRQAYIVLL